MAKAANDASTVEYGIEYNSSADRYRFWWDTASVDANIHGSPSGDSSLWTLITCWHNSSDNTIHIKINNEADDSTSHTGGTDTTSGLSVGKLGDDDALYATTKIDAMGISKVVPLQADLDWIWNGGNGQEMP
jgi:hypothetical protein